MRKSVPYIAIAATLIVAGGIYACFTARPGPVLVGAAVLAAVVLGAARAVGGPGGEG